MRASLTEIWMGSRMTAKDSIVGEQGGYIKVPYVVEVEAARVLKKSP